MKKKEFKVGEVFQCGLVKLEVKEMSSDRLCKDCFFEYYCSDSLPMLIGHCLGMEREDKTHVIFVKVEE